MKAINVNNVIHYIDNYYRLIIIQGAEELLIYIILSYSLNKLLNKQKGKKNLIKTEVYNIYRFSPTPDKLNILENINLVIK